VTVVASPVAMKATMRLPAAGAEVSAAASEFALPAVPAVAACATDGVVDVEVTALEGVLAAGGSVVAGVTGGTFAAPGKALPLPLPPPQADSAEAAIKETRARRAIAVVET
jgi:hypothetical protein